ncbi:MAG: hypothetical protein CM15mP85_27760 [Rhodobacterales bacterium]|nr:MAG: hypothetical protein CM15mP85_27760 [Rhodobacterales bacterium]
MGLVVRTLEERIEIPSHHLICDSSTRGTNASGQINSVVSSYDGKVTRYSETQFSYTKSENDAETGSASSQIIFEREKSQDLTVGHFIGFQLVKILQLVLNPRILSL